MNFAFCTDNRYAVPTLVSITSLLENNREEVCRVYVLTEGLEDETIGKFNQLASIYNQEIVVVEVPKDAFQQLKTRHRYPVSMYYRWLLPELLPEEANRVLYLDSDICVRHNLRPLFDPQQTDLTEKACGVVEDQRSDEICHQNRLQTETTYFNSGVLLMNLDYWRKYNVKQQLSDFVMKNEERCLFPDQDALNAVLAGKVIYLPYTYNFQEQWYWEHSEQAISWKKWDAIARDAEDPAIVHYTWNLKPWHEQCWHKHKEWFREYGQLHPFIGFHIEPKYKPSFYTRCWARLAKICFAQIRHDSHFSGSYDIESFFHL